MTTTNESIIGVVGAGAMGNGIAQVAAAAGHRVVVGDAVEGVTARASAATARAMTRDVASSRRTRDDADVLASRIDYQWSPLNDDYGAYKDCDLVIEAVSEEIATKAAVFRGLQAVVKPDCILATNTSSLSVTALAAACGDQGRVIGAHFFNPAPAMRLVEVVPWLATDPAVTSTITALMGAWGKTPVRASDTPGFIVNRVARSFYGEALRIYEEGSADIPTIDAAMRARGFKMGPFELMDFIGNDINFAVTVSTYQGFWFEPRYRPALTQQRLVEAGLLGRKTDRGYYDYREGATPPSPSTDDNLRTVVSDRIITMLMNEAIDAVFQRVASPRDIDLAMTLGVRYPKGLIAWAEELGYDRVLDRMTRLQEEYGEDRYRPSPLLRRLVRDGASLLVQGV